MNDVPNLQVVRTLLRHLDKPESLIQYVTDRPGHDRRYAMDATRIQRRAGLATRATRFEEGWPADHRLVPGPPRLAGQRAQRRVRPVLREPLQ